MTIQEILANEINEYVAIRDICTYEEITAGLEIPEKLNGWDTMLYINKKYPKSVFRKVMIPTSENYTLLVDRLDIYYRDVYPRLKVIGELGT